MTKLSMDDEELKNYARGIKIINTERYRKYRKNMVIIITLQYLWIAIGYFLLGVIIAGR